MPRPMRIRAVTPLEEFTIRREFTDNTTKDIDLKPYLHGPIFEPIRKDLRLFHAMKVDPRLGIIVWDNRADMAPAWLSKSSRCSSSAMVDFLLQLTMV